MRWRMKLLELANEKFGSVDQIKFKHVDMHGNMKVMIPSYKFTQKMTLQTYCLSWTVNLSVLAKSIPVMVTENKRLVEEAVSYLKIIEDLSKGLTSI